MKNKILTIILIGILIAASITTISIAKKNKDESSKPYEDFNWLNDKPKTTGKNNIRAETWTNTAPKNSNPYPSDESTVSSSNIEWLKITISDVNDVNQSFNITFSTNASGVWQIIQINNSVNNGSYKCIDTSWITDYSTIYYWNVSTNDGADGWDNDSYWFCTESEPEENDGYTAYYVSNTNGSDSDDGTTPALAWKTLTYAWSQLREGDRLYILAGTYDERVRVYNKNIHGNTTHPIIIEPHENDLVYLKEGNYTIWGGQWNCYYNYHISFRDLNWINCKRFGLYMGTDDPSKPCHNISVYNCTFKNITDSAIKISGNTDPVKDVIIERCYLWDICNSYAMIADQEGISVAGGVNVRLNDTFIGKCAKQSIDFKSGSNNCEFYDFVINTTHNRGYLTDERKFLGGGIYIDAWSSFAHNISCHDGIIYGNKTGITIGIENTGYVENCSFYNILINISNDDVSTYGILINKKDGQSDEARMRYLDFKHITIYGAYRAIGFDIEGYKCIGFNFSNNILSGIAGDYCIWLNESNYNLSVHNNLFTDDSEYWGKNAINGSPDYFENGKNFQLKSTSDAIDAGLQTEFFTDLIGNTRFSSGSNYDIGAYEYQLFA